jgi:hypothetical protein
MSKKTFTDDEIRSMKENPYTHKVSEKTIRFTAAFKEEFWQRYQSGETPTQIIKALGYDEEVFGIHRIEGILTNIKEQAISGVGFYEGHCRPKRRATAEYYESVSPPRALALMQNEIIYLRQEVEFIKKNLNADSGKGRSK